MSAKTPRKAKMDADTKAAMIAASDTAVEQVAKKLSIKEFLALPKDQRPKVLKEKTLSVSTQDGTEIELTVRQLTKAEVGVYNTRILSNMPTVPTIEHTTMQAAKDPKTGQVRPAGTYREPNPSDPVYLRAMDVWLNEACVLLALCSAHESMDVEIDSEEFDALAEDIGTTFGPESLMSIAFAAAQVNPGLHVSEQIMAQYYRQAASALAFGDMEGVLGDGATD